MIVTLALYISGIALTSALITMNLYDAYTYDRKLDILEKVILGLLLVSLSSFWVALIGHMLDHYNA